MDKNTVTGFVLIALVLIGFSWWSQPSAEQIEQQRLQDSIAQVKEQQAEKQKTAAAEKKVAAEKAALQDTTFALHNALKGETKDVVLKNGKLELTLSTKGAAVRKAVIKGYKDADDSNDVTLFKGEEQNLSFVFNAKNTNISTSDLYFTPSEQTDSTVTFTAAAGDGKSIRLRYRLGSDYMLHFDVATPGMSGMFAPGMTQMDVLWTDSCRQHERGFYFENRYSNVTYKTTEGDIDNLVESGDDDKTLEEDALDWVCFKNQFFSAVLISKDGFAKNAHLLSTTFKNKQEKNGILKAYDARLKTQFDPSGAQPSAFEMYLGPNEFRKLQAVADQSQFGKDLKLERLIYFGWPLIRYINRWFTLYIFEWLTAMHINMGIVLILITILLKAITFPMVRKSYLSSAKMRVLKPKFEEATKQYDKPEDAMQKQQAMMQLYSQYGVSPMGGCLPMLIQMPIWIAMFNFVPNAIQLRGESFLWITDLSTYDPIIEWGTNLWLIGDHLSLSCVLFCGTNIIYSWLTMRQQQDQMVGQQAEQMKMMQWMMFLMPVMFFFMFNDYSAGLNFYYFVSLLLSAIIMWTLRKTTDDQKLLEILEAKYKENKNNPKKQNTLISRLEAMKKQEEELKRQRLQKK